MKNIHWYRTAGFLSQLFAVIKVFSGIQFNHIMIKNCCGCYKTYSDPNVGRIRMICNFVVCETTFLQTLALKKCRIRFSTLDI